MTTVNVEILETTAEHIRELADTLRDGDRREIESFGYSIMKGLWKTYKSGNMRKTAMIDGKVAAIWGVCGSLLGSIGQPYLLTSYEVNKVSPIVFARIYRQEARNMLKLFPVLINYVLSDYVEAVRMLQICGFILGEPEKLGNGFYRKFTMSEVRV